MKLFLEILSIFVVMAFFACTFIFHDKKRKKEFEYYKDNGGTGSMRNYKDVPKEQIKKYNIENLNDLKIEFYDTFLKFIEASNNLDLLKLKGLCSSHFFQNFQMGLNLENKKDKRRIIELINKKEIIIHKIRGNVGSEVYSVLINIDCLDYKIFNDGKILSGSKGNVIDKKYNIVFKKQSKVDTVCLNCGAKLIKGKCPYCKTVFNDNKYKINSLKEVTYK